MFGNRKSQITPCGAIVRANDRDRFLVSLTVPAVQRPALWALFAFNYEIARTREVVSEKTLGYIRLQWWRDALAALYERDEVLSHEVVTELAAAIKAHKLPRAAFDELIDARMADLEDKPPADIEAYARATSVPLARLAVDTVGENAVDNSVDNVAVAYALTGLLRAAPFHAAQGRHYIALGNEKTVGERAKELLESSSPRNRFSRASARLARLYLGQIAGVNYDIYSQRLQIPPFFFHARFFTGI